MRTPLSKSVLSLTLAAILAGAAHAAPAPPAPPPPPTPRAMPAPAPRAAPGDEAAIRAEIDRLAARIHELARQLGPEDRVHIERRRMGPGEPFHDGPGPHGEGPRMERRMHMEGMPGGAPTIGIGVVLAPNSAATGVKLAAVTPEGPAAKGGLRSGDVLLAVDGRKIGGSGEAAVEQARGLLKGLKKNQSVRLSYVRAGKAGQATVVAGDIRRMMLLGGGPEGMPGFDTERLRMLDPMIDGELRRVLPMAQCAPGSRQCDAPALFEAFRWQGLNLAAVDADLGRYFGTEHGVLVLSGGPGLTGLKSGDIVQKVGGQAVETPREVMRALRGKEVGSELPLVVLRERKPVTVTITVPAAQPLPFMPPAPPVPPVPPVPPTPMAAPAPPAPPPPPPGHGGHPMPAPMAQPRAPTPPAAPAPPPPPPDAAFEGDFDESMLVVDAPVD